MTFQLCAASLRPKSRTALPTPHGPRPYRATAAQHPPIAQDYPTDPTPCHYARIACRRSGKLATAARANFWQDGFATRVLTCPFALQEAVAEGPPLRLLRAAPEDPPGSAGPQVVGMRHSGQGEDHLGGWPVQAGGVVSRWYATPMTPILGQTLLSTMAADINRATPCRVSHEAPQV